ncbi:MAG: 3-deoxy-7-phosphoheptulonate synthase [Gammaproteobacteria bacterium]
MPDNLRIQSQRPLIQPKILLDELPLTQKAADTVRHARETTQQIMQGKDHRLLVIVGPCSIHDPNAALDYANLLHTAAEQFADDLFLVMRVYFEKPRTNVGWKGLISDPYLNESYDINHGIRLARKLLLDLNTLGIPAATEFLDTMIPLYLSDLISWTAVGARTSASQLHRELASGLPMPVGFKNSIDGNATIAVDAVKVAAHSHHFLSFTTEGLPTIIRTEGNPNCHVILRGSQHSTNYESHHVQQVATSLKEAKLTQRLMIDCSHGNSMKNYLRQKDAVDSIVAQLNAGIQIIGGVMLESNLIAGKQTLGIQPLIYGQSITDGCVSWEETLPLLEKLAQANSNKVAPQTVQRDLKQGIPAKWDF